MNQFVSRAIAMAQMRHFVSITLNPPCRPHLVRRPRWQEAQMSHVKLGIVLRMNTLMA